METLYKGGRMSLWEDLGMELKIRKILDVKPYTTAGHLGRPFMTPYQIAIEFESKYPKEFEALGKPVGGKHTGQETSLAQYIANELSKRCKRKALPWLEGRLLCRKHVRELSYKHGSATVTSSSEQAYDLSMYRHKD